MKKSVRPSPSLGAVEQAAMDYFWRRSEGSAEACRESLAQLHPLKDSTIRTMLRRLEEKGLLQHRVEGRTFIYRAAAQPSSLAARAVRHIMNRFCGGSAEALVLGLVDQSVLQPEQLERLAKEIAAQRAKQGTKP